MFIVGQVSGNVFGYFNLPEIESSYLEFQLIQNNIYTYTFVYILLNKFTPFLRNIAYVHGSLCQITLLHHPSFYKTDRGEDEWNDNRKN